jgi:hypothetical protein
MSNRDRRGNTAARGEFTDDFHLFRFDHLDQIVEDVLISRS